MYEPHLSPIRMSPASLLKKIVERVSPTTTEGAPAPDKGDKVAMVFGELLPKNMAIAKPEPVARWLARSTTIYLAVFGPVITIFDKAAELLLRLLHIEPVHDVEHSATPRDLEHIVAESRETGELPAQLSTLLDRVLDFPTRSAEHAMIPRGNVDTVSVDDLAGDVLDLGLRHIARERPPG